MMNWTGLPPTRPYVPIREGDSTIKSLSSNEREFIHSCAFLPRPLRTDGRDWKQLRAQHLQLSRQDNGAVATVQWGRTRTTCSCTAELIPPNPDRPSEGMVTLSVDLSPSASTAFRHAQPVTTTIGSSGKMDTEQKLLANRIIRCLERMLLVGGALDTEALCVTPSEWVWRLVLEVTVLDASGNLLDACSLACMAALRHYRKPHLDMSTVPPKLVSADFKEPTPLPLHHTPLTVSFALLQNTSEKDDTVVALMDPNAREELVMKGQLTLAMNVHGELCLLDYGGGCELQVEKLKECHDLAKNRVQQLCQSLEMSLAQADEQALSDRLRRLQQIQEQQLPPLPAFEYDDLNGIPFYRKEEVMKIDVDRTENEAEEAYRRQTLDYNVGHIAAKVRDDEEDKPKQSHSLLLAAIIQLAKVAQDQPTTGVMPPPLHPQTAPTTESSRPTEQPALPNTLSPAPTLSTKVPTLTAADSEEEEPVQLISEFATLANGPAAMDVDNADDDSVEDLSAAIKKNRKKKGNKK